MTLLGLTERFSIWSQGTVAASGRKLSFIWLTSKKKCSLYGVRDIYLWSYCQSVAQYLTESGLAIKTPQAGFQQVVLIQTLCHFVVSPRRFLSSYLKYLCDEKKVSIQFLWGHQLMLCAFVFGGRMGLNAGSPTYSTSKITSCDYVRETLINQLLAQAKKMQYAILDIFENEK